MCLLKEKKRFNFYAHIITVVRSVCKKLKTTARTTRLYVNQKITLNIRLIYNYCVPLDLNLFELRILVLYNLSVRVTSSPGTRETCVGLAFNSFVEHLFFCASFLSFVYSQYILCFLLYHALFAESNQLPSIVFQLNDVSARNTNDSSGDDLTYHCFRKDVFDQNINQYPSYR